jgi:hypothetical protein
MTIRRKIWFNMFICFIIYIDGRCQSNLSLPTGLAKENKEYITKNKVKGIILVSSSVSADKRLRVSLDQYLPNVLNQGSQGSCTAFAVAEALSIRENYTNKCLRTSSISQILYSPTYLWVNQERAINDNCKIKGISYSEAFSCIFNDKIVYWSIYPYPLDDNNLCHSTCPPEIKKKKIDNRKFAYQDVILDTTSFKNLLKRGFPICIATDLDLNFYEALHNRNENGRWVKKGVKTGEQHAMVIVDYDDDIRCFKVLDSHGKDVGDKGFIWLSYDLVNRNLDLGAVYGCYIVSFDKISDIGPSKNFHGLTAADNFPKIVATYNDSVFTGKVIMDESGTSAPGVIVSVEGTSIATSTNVDGSFIIKASSDATLIISSIGFSAKSMKFGYKDSTIYNNNICTTWTKKGYYRIFNNIRIGIINLSKNSNTVLISIIDDRTGELLINNFELTVGENASLKISNKELNIKLTKIEKAGNKLNLLNQNAAFLEYRLNSDAPLTQYF